MGWPNTNSIIHDNTWRADDVKSVSRETQARESERLIKPKLPRDVSDKSIDWRIQKGCMLRAHLATGNESSPGLPGSPILVSLHFISDARVVVSFLYSAVSVPTLFLPPCFLRERALIEFAEECF